MNEEQKRETPIEASLTDKQFDDILEQFIDARNEEGKSEDDLWSYDDVGCFADQDIRGYIAALRAKNEELEARVKELEEEKLVVAQKIIALSGGYKNSRVFLEKVCDLIDQAIRYEKSSTPLPAAADAQEPEKYVPQPLKTPSPSVPPCLPRTVIKDMIRKVDGTPQEPAEEPRYVCDHCGYSGIEIDQCNHIKNGLCTSDGVITRCHLGCELCPECGLPFHKQDSSPPSAADAQGESQQSAASSPTGTPSVPRKEK